MFGPASDDELVDTIAQMHGIANASLRILLAGIVEVDQRQLWRIDAAASVEAWLTMRHGVSYATARSWMRAGRGLVFCPSLAQAFADGHLSFDQLVAAIDLVAFGGADEAAIAAEAVGRSAAELERLAREARRVTREEALDRDGREYLKLRWDRTGMLRVNGRLSDANGKVVESALRRIADDDPRGDGMPRRPYEKRTAEALFALASARLATDADPDLATVVLHIDAHALTSGNDAIDLAKVQLGPVVAMATAHRLACDGRCQVVVDDLFGRTVDVAKTVHAVPRWMRRRVIDRDGGCRWPGCGRTALLHAHHLVFWSHGGSTEEANLVALCWFHHHAVHEGGWTVSGDPFDRLAFLSPLGMLLTVGPPGLRPDVADELGIRWVGDPPPVAA